MTNENQTQVALVERLREIGYEVDENGGAYIAQLDGSCAHIIVGRDNTNLNDIDVSHDKAARILAILAEPDRPVVPLTLFAPRLAEAMADVENVRVTDSEGEIGIPSFTLLLKPRRNGDILIEFRPVNAETLDERVVTFAKKHTLTVPSDYADFSDLAADIRGRADQILAIARGIEKAGKS